MTGCKDRMWVGEIVYEHRKLIEWMEVIENGCEDNF
jgi:hypothetical protein